MILESGYCREIVYWPFPFAIASLLAFLLILASEVLTKTESRFKEAFIAWMGFIEMFSWLTVAGFFY